MDHVPQRSARHGLQATMDWNRGMHLYNLLNGENSKPPSVGFCSVCCCDKYFRHAQFYFNWNVWQRLAEDDTRSVFFCSQENRKFALSISVTIKNIHLSTFTIGFKIVWCNMKCGAWVYFISVLLFIYFRSLNFYAYVFQFSFSSISELSTRVAFISYYIRHTDALACEHLQFPMLFPILICAHNSFTHKI